jgi:predicted nuclease of restriction endonuclease-like (RecB) superfamily
MIITKENLHGQDKIVFLDIEIFTTSKEITQNIDSLYLSVSKILENARNKVYQTANIEMLQAYWNVGRLIVEEEQNGEDRAAYGSFLIRNLSEKLTYEYSKGHTESNLKYMRQFYQTFEKSHALRGELSWTHYRLLLKVEKENVRDFYIKEAITGNWSTRQLERQINSLFYDRILASKDKKGMILDGRVLEDKMQPENIIKDPFVLEFLNMKENAKLAEKKLETALIEKLQHFLLELGNGFSFVGRQYRITADNEHFYIDLVFYNYILKCFLLIDLKTEKLTHQDIGQMDFYVRFFEDKMKQPGDNPTIGLILCTEKNKTIVKYSLLGENKQIFASKYQLYLPSEKQLEQEIQRELEQIEQEKNLLQE